MFRLEAHPDHRLIRRADITFPAASIGSVIFYGVVVVVALVAIPYGTVEPWWVGAFEVSIFALTILWAIEFWFSGGAPLTSYALLLPLVGILILAAAQILPFGPISFDPYETKSFIFKLLALALAGVLLQSQVSSRLRLRALVNVVIGIGAASSLYGLTRAWTTSTSNFAAGAGGFAQFVNRNHFAFLAEMSFGLVLGLLLAGALNRRRFVTYLLAGIVIWAGLVMAGSRGGLLTMLSQVGFILLMTSGTPIWRSPFRTGVIGTMAFQITVATALIIALALAVIWIGGESLSQRVQQDVLAREFTLSTNDSTTRIRRVDMWKATVEVIRDHPLAGVGFGGYWLAIPQYLQYSGNRELHQAHNDYLEILASGGLIAGVLFVWFGLMVIVKSRRHLDSPDPFRRAACLGALTGMFGVAAHSLVDFGLHVTINALVFTTLVVIATAELKRSPDASAN